MIVTHKDGNRFDCMAEMIFTVPADLVSVDPLEYEYDGGKVYGTGEARMLHILSLN